MSRSTFSKVINREVTLRQAEGHPKFRIYKEPKQGAEVIDEWPNDEYYCWGKQGNFWQVEIPWGQATWIQKAG